MKDVPGIFASMVFGDDVMRARLPKDIYKNLRRTIESGRQLDPGIASVIAGAMKDWAVEKGATHFTHWFQPMTGVTAEKHDSFISPDGHGHVIMEFSGRELIRGESDASSFPSGGLRATFEARGYTAWDPTSYAFIKDETLYIPTAFCSYGGQALDKKTPLLRSMEAIERQALRVLKLFGNEDVRRVYATVGPEQEYFLVDREVWKLRPDLRDCGRTLFGAKPSKGQEMDDHYYGAIAPRVAEYMKELDRELWKLGVLAKTKHNEAAPAQHELAPIYTSVNLATDHNQLTMELMRTIAERHGMVCLLHEKPFAGINGSGKHNNWSLQTDTGVNLLEPGDTPSENAQFLLFLVAVIKAVDEYPELLRVSVASAGNDHRLGAHEAPPAIMSMFLGDQLTEILNTLEAGMEYHEGGLRQMEIGVTVLPRFPRDTTDRNRTSPFAFTGNKFEFRSPGSSFSIAEPNIVLNTIIAEELSQFADVLEHADDFRATLDALIRRTIREHRRVLFDGNNYSRDWVEEAARRGLPNLLTTPDALAAYATPKNIDIFERHHVLTEAEIRSRCEIMLENYCKTLHIEARTFADMVKRAILPASLTYQNTVAQLLERKTALKLPVGLETRELLNLGTLTESLVNNLDTLTGDLAASQEGSTAAERARFYRDHIRTDMEQLRAVVDELEARIPAEIWPYPDYGELLYSVR
ncbi:MAG: glutamine synthetase III [Eubacteriales bacterium]|jgi:glutamine synthetase